MKTKIFVAASLAVLALFNGAIVQKEKILRDGETVYLNIAPRDPRSVMQGDYMDLRYAAATGIPHTADLHGRVVVATGPDHVATYARVDDGRPLKENEKRMRYDRDGETTIMPASYMFQEGQASYYRPAKYAIFRFDGPDNYVLAGLADENRKQIIAPKTSLETDINKNLSKNIISVQFGR